MTLAIEIRPKLGFDLVILDGMFVPVTQFAPVAVGGGFAGVGSAGSDSESISFRIRHKKEVDARRHAPYNSGERDPQPVGHGLADIKRNRSN